MVSDEWDVVGEGVGSFLQLLKRVNIKSLGYHSQFNTFIRKYILRKERGWELFSFPPLSACRSLDLLQCYV